MAGPPELIAPAEIAQFLVFRRLRSGTSTVPSPHTGTTIAVGFLKSLIRIEGEHCAKPEQM